MSPVETVPVLLKKVVLERRLESNHSDPWGRKNKGKRFWKVLCQTSQQMAQGQDSASKDIFLPWEHWPVSNGPASISYWRREKLQIWVWIGQLEQYCSNMSISVGPHNTWLGIKTDFRIWKLAIDALEDEKNSKQVWGADCETLSPPLATQTETDMN